MGVFGWSLPPGCSTVPGDETGVMEVWVDGVWHALDENNVVYRQTGNCTERDDGYERIGVLPDADADADYVALVREFARSVP